MALYLANFNDWANVSFNNTPNRITAYGILRRAYQNSVAIPNIGMNLRIFGIPFIYSPNDLTTPVLTLPEVFEVSSPKNSINANDYILGSSVSVQIFFEVG
jgi:hypothetical protein